VRLAHVDQMRKSSLKTPIVNIFNHNFEEKQVQHRSESTETQDDSSRKPETSSEEQPKTVTPRLRTKRTVKPPDRLTYRN
jgi:hypothetical protein